MLIEQTITVEGRSVSVTRRIEDSGSTTQATVLPEGAQTVTLPNSYTEPLQISRPADPARPPVTLMNRPAPSTTTLGTGGNPMPLGPGGGPMDLGPGGGPMDLGPGGGSMDLGPGGTGAGGITIVFGSVVVNCSCASGLGPGSRTDDES